MRAYVLPSFGVENLRLVERPEPTPRANEVRLKLDALSLNYRDLLVMRGQYNPALQLPATPVSDAAGVVTAAGAEVSSVRVGDRVTTHFVADWLDGPFQQAYLATTLGTPGPGAAAESVAVPSHAVVPPPQGYSAEEAATLPIAALTAWSALVTVGRVEAGHTVLTLGTGGVSIFALQFAKALGARVVITSRSDEKLRRAAALGADVCINTTSEPNWERAVLAATDGLGVDLTVENAGPGTLDRSMKATRAGGVIGLLGALTGRQGPITTGLILMKRLRIFGIMVDSRAAFAEMNRFIEKHRIRPIIDRRFTFEQLPDAVACMAAGEHFGKIVLTFP